MPQGVDFTSQDIARLGEVFLMRHLTTHPPCFETFLCLQEEFTLLNLTWKALKDLDL